MHTTGGAALGAPRGLPAFPLRSKPFCRHCGSVPQSHSIVAPTNPNGNAGRRFYACVQCRLYAAVSSSPHGKGWITWDDNGGLAPSNPTCFCGFIARQDRAGVDSNAPGQGFWTCSTGACAYTSWRRDGRPTGQADGWTDGFRPWLLG